MHFLNCECQLLKHHEYKQRCIALNHADLQGGKRVAWESSPDASVDNRYIPDQEDMKNYKCFDLQRKGKIFKAELVFTTMPN